MHIMAEELYEVFPIIYEGEIANIQNHIGLCSMILIMIMFAFTTIFKYL